MSDESLDWARIIRVVRAYLREAYWYGVDDPSDEPEVHAIRLHRAVVAERVHEHAWLMSAAMLLPDREREMVGELLGEVGPWVLPDADMEAEMVGLRDAIVTREMRREGRWVDRRRSRPLPGRQGPPLGPEPRDADAQAWTAYVAGVSGLEDLPPYVAAQLSLPGLRVGRDRHRVGMNAVTMLGLPAGGRGELAARWRETGLTVLKDEGWAFCPDLNHAEYWVDALGRHRLFDWGRMARWTGPPLALWQAARGWTSGYVHVVPWRPGAGFAPGPVNGGIRAYLAEVSGVDLGLGDIRSFDFRQAAVQAATHQRSLAVAEGVLARRGGAAERAALTDWLAKYGPRVVDDGSQPEAFAPAPGMVLYVDDWKVKRWREVG